MGKPFVPTHQLKDDIPALKLKAGTLIRQINPFADGRWDHRWCLEEKDHPGNPWIFVSDELVPLPDWPRLQQEMIDQIGKRVL
jgi:hypothetical protein